MRAHHATAVDVELGGEHAGADELGRQVGQRALDVRGDERRRRRVVGHSLPAQAKVAQLRHQTRVEQDVS